MQFCQSLKKFTRAYLFQIALEIIWLPIQITPVCVDIIICPFSEKKQSRRKNVSFLYAETDMLFFVLFTLENYDLVNYKQRWTFEVLIHRPLGDLFQMTASQFWSNHSEYKVTLKPIKWTCLRQSRAFAIRSTDGFLYERFSQGMKIIRRVIK